MSLSVSVLLLLLFNGFIGGVFSLCEYYYDGTPKNGTDYTIPSASTYNSALSSLNLTLVFNDLYDILTTSDSCWPADTFNGESSYAGLFLRLAWHAAGTFRTTDGAGGAAGGRLRYDPEAGWYVSFVFFA